MSGGFTRGLASLAGALLRHVYPKSQSGWVRAMRTEIDRIEGDGAALGFALGCLWGGCREAVAERLSSMFEGIETMFEAMGKLRQPRNLGVACALAAVCLGIAYMAAAGAPAGYLAVNGAAFVLGIVALKGFAGAASQTERLTSPLLVLLGFCLLGTAMFGASADGVSRWIRIGPLSVQLSFVVLPLMIVAFARRPNAIGTVGIAIAAVALALQPDRAMAGVLAFAMALLAALRPGRNSIAAFAVSFVAFAASLARPDPAPTVPFVDQIFYTAFDVHMLAGAAIVLGSLLLLVPSVWGWRFDPARGHVYLVFGAVWLGCVAAAALGNYPTPVVGYGGSAILGYLLSLAYLPKGVSARFISANGSVADDKDRLSRLPKAALPA